MNKKFLEYSLYVILLAMFVTALYYDFGKELDNNAYAFDQDLVETRYCGEPKRDANGVIIRRSDVVRAFKKVHPCPLTGLSTGACEGWQVDHVIPLACGGCDGVSNLQWLPEGLKTVAVIGKDRWERKIYGGVIVSTSCTAPPIK